MTPSLTIPQAIELALQYHQAGQLQAAETIYRQILQLQPQQPDALHLLGMVAYEVGEFDNALTLIRRAIATHPQQAQFHYHLGMVWQAKGKLEKAQLSYQHAISLQPDFFQAYHGLATVFVATQQLVQAEACFRQWLARQPASAEAYDHLGSVLGMRGQFKEAEACYRQALIRRPDWAAAHLHLGNALGAQRRLIEAEQCYRQALQWQPELVEAHSNLGKVLQAQGKLEEAQASYRQALLRQPDQAGLQFKTALLMPVIMSSIPSILDTRREMADRLAQLLEHPPTLSDPFAEEAWGNHFYRIYHGENERDFQSQLAQLYSQSCPQLRYVAAHCGTHTSTKPKPKKKSRPLKPRKIKIGFVSSLFLEGQVVTKFIGGLIANLSREKFTVSVFSSAKTPSEVSPLLQTGADHFEQLPLDLTAARQRIAASQLDILFYPDLGLEAFTYFLAFARLAKVQCTSWGHPVTSGIPTIDYFISATALELAEAQTHYTERLIQLKYLPCFYYPPALSSPLKTRQDFGLPEQQPIYLCPQSLFKLHPDFDNILADILALDSMGLVVLVAGEQPYWTELLQQRLQQTLPATLHERLRWLPRQDLNDYLHLLAIADVMLDPIHFGGGITTLDALAVGTPIVTWPSQFSRGRMTYYCYQQMGMMDGIAHSTSEYVELAVRLGTQADYRQAIKTKILTNHQVLYENPAVVRELEEFFERVVNI